MKALVTGNLGFIGGAITDQLIKREIEVIGVDKNRNSREPRSRLEITKFVNTANKKDMEQFKRYEIDYIFHFGSPCSNMQFMKKPKSLTETVAGMVNVFEIAKEVGAKVVYPSSCTVYAGELPQTENTVLPPPTTLYSVGKIACEHTAHYYRETYDVESTGARIFVAYGPREENKGNLASAVTQFLMSIERGQHPVIWGDGTQFRDAIYVDDVAELLVRIAQDPKSPNIINVGTGQAVTFNDMVLMINRKLGKNVTPKYISKPIWYRGNNKADMALAKKLYGFNPRSLDKGLTDYIKYRSEKELTKSLVYSVSA